MDVGLKQLKVMGRGADDGRKRVPVQNLLVYGIRKENYHRRSF